MLAVVAFLGGVSAASAMMIVTSLALSHMCLNHLVLPASYPDPKLDLYRWLLWTRHFLIALIIAAGYLFYLILEHNEGLVQLGLISFVAVAQFLPGIVGLIFWPRATRMGFNAGLCAGAAVWAYTLLIPLFQNAGLMPDDGYLAHMMEATGQDKWSFATFWSLTANALAFTIISIFTRQTREEQDAARACSRGSPVMVRERIKFAAPAKLIEQLARIIGKDAAEREVNQALTELRIQPDEQRSMELQRLRERIERNLSGLMGPALARVILDKRVQMDTAARSAFGNSMRYIEERLEESHTQMRGVLAQMDSLRRYHRQVLMELPLGVCALGSENEVVLWNLAMEILSGIERDRAVGITIEQLPAPWNYVFAEFAVSADQHQHKRKIDFAGKNHWLNLHKAAIDQPFADEERMDEAAAPGTGMVILVEDLTELQILEAELTHSERLASIGRLAAGVAHEIGNPVTGIACLAQNMRYETERDAMADQAEEILEQTKRISDIVQTLVSFSHGGKLLSHTKENFALQQCAEEAVRLVRLTHAGKQVACVNQISPDAVVHGDRQRMIQVFVNLLTNACDASQPDSSVELSSLLEGGNIDIRVSDTGHGIPDDVLAQIFEPFYTTKDPGQGTGLGLPMVYSIVQDHGGHITVNSSSDGTTITIRLPLAIAEQPSETESA
jgi:signal transduction histidine kinase